MGQVIFWCLAGFFAGSIPFSVLVGRLFLKTDIRQYGDGNPGGTNAWKAGGWSTGILASFLDMLKGYLPVMLAVHSGLSGWELVPVAIAPILGHAFSPFLKFHGGKALGATGGVWIALIGFKALAIYLLLTLPVLALQKEDALASNAGLLSLLAYSIWFERSPSLATFALLDTGLVAWKHRRDLARPFHLRPWAAAILNRREA
jgi:glycerol-3-phosphate acyltransferase PlsY